MKSLHDRPHRSKEAILGLAIREELARNLPAARQISQPHVKSPGRTSYRLAVLQIYRLRWEIRWRRSKTSWRCFKSAIRARNSPAALREWLAGLCNLLAAGTPGDLDSSQPISSSTSIFGVRPGDSELDLRTGVRGRGISAPGRRFGVGPASLGREPFAVGRLPADRHDPGRVRYPAEPATRTATPRSAPRTASLWDGSAVRRPPAGRSDPNRLMSSRTRRSISR